DDHRAVSGVSEVGLYAALVFAQLQNMAEIFIRHHDGCLDPRLLDMVDMRDVRHIGGIVQLHHAAVAHMQAIDDRRRCRDQIEIKLALKPLLDDLEMQQAEEAAAKAEAKRGG